MPLFFVNVSLLFTVMVSEFGLCAFYAIKNRDGRYFVYPPNLRNVQKIKPAIMPRIGGIARFYTNSCGIIGDFLFDCSNNQKEAKFVY